MFVPAQHGVRERGVSTRTQDHLRHPAGAWFWIVRRLVQPGSSLGLLRLPSMRLAYCYLCRDLERLDDYDIDFNDPRSADHDVLLANWIERHMHGRDVDDHPGGRIFPFDDSRENVSREMRSMAGTSLKATGVVHDALGLKALEMEAVQQVKKVLSDQQMEVNEYRDQLREDAGKCFIKHSNPEWPGKPCLDYQARDKRLGRKDTPKQHQQFLCTYCPYESSVTVGKRHKRGDYK